MEVATCAGVIKRCTFKREVMTGLMETGSFQVSDNDGDM
jgi:hypothetical protein